MAYHSALQAMNILCSSARTFLGPKQRLKCILEDGSGDGLLVSSCSELLCNLDIEHPVGRVVQDACLAHHRAHGTGTTTMVNLAGFWAAEMETIIHQGVPLSAIIRYGDECLEQSLTALENLALPWNQLSTAEKNWTETSTDAKSQACLLNSKGKLSHNHEESFNVDLERICACLDNVCVHHNDSSQTEALQGCNLGVTQEELAKHHPNPKHFFQTDSSDDDSDWVCTAFSEKESQIDTLVDSIDTGNQFWEVHLKTIKPSRSRLTESGCGTVPEKEKLTSVDPDDDLSWFFDRDSDTPSSNIDLKQHGKDCEALFKTLDDRPGTKKSDSFSTEHMTLSSGLMRQMDAFVSSKLRETTEDNSSLLNTKDLDSSSEVTEKSMMGESATSQIHDFDSCFSVEELECILKKDVVGKSKKFGSCFPIDDLDCIPEAPKKVAIRNSTESVSDDEFDSCFPEQKPDTIHKIHEENTKTESTGNKNGSDFDSYVLIDQPRSLFQSSKESRVKKLKEDKTDDILGSGFHFGTDENSRVEIGNCDKVVSRSDQKDTNDCSTAFCGSLSTVKSPTSTVDESSSNAAKCNIDNSIPTFNKNLRAIEESLHTLLQVKGEQSLSKRLANVQNSSRHFRNVETVLNQHSSVELSLRSHSSGSEVISEMKGTAENNWLKCSTLKSSRLAHPELKLANPELLNLDQDLPSAPTKTCYPDADATSKIIHKEDVKHLRKPPKAKITSVQLAKVLSSSRHFSSKSQLSELKSAAEHDNLASGQHLDSGAQVERPAYETVTLMRTTVTNDKKIGQVDSGHHTEKLTDNFQHCTSHKPDISKQLKMTSKANLVHSAGVVEMTSLTKLGQGLSHGSDLEMKLVIEAFQLQARHKRRDKNTQWNCDLNRLSVCSIAGPPTQESHLQAGVVVPVDCHYRSTISKTGGKYLKALLVNGDVTPTFSHPGYKNKVEVMTVHEHPSLSPSGATSWLEKVGKLLEELDIGLVILKGHADECLDHLCLSKEVILLQNVPYKTLLGLGEASSAPLLTYLGDATADDVANGVTVACLESGCVERIMARHRDPKRKVFAVINMDGQLLQTAVLCHPVASLLTASEARFWTCAHRLQNVVRDGRYLPGAGLPEQTAIKNLQKFSASNSTTENFDHLSCYKNSVVAAFLEGLVQFLIQVLKNMGRCTDVLQAKTHIMASLLRNRLEPVLSSRNQTELAQCSSYVSGEKLPNTSSEICHDHFEPDLTHDCQFKNSVLTDSKFHKRTRERDPGGKRRNTLPCSRCHCLNSNHYWSGDVYDSYVAKKAAWENSWALLKTVLRIDAHITTGVQHSDQSFQWL